MAFQKMTKLRQTVELQKYHIETSNSLTILENMLGLDISDFLIWFSKSEDVQHSSLEIENSRLWL